MKYNSISATAPRFTDAEDEREVAELSQQEKDAILADALGLSAENENDQDISPELIDRFHNQMDQIPLEQKTIYTRAREQCPLVVAAESDPERFLRSRNYDPKAAASLMAIYWEKRYEFFEERAFLPMTLSGAMEADVDVLRGIPNWFRTLPDDEHGRGVLCINREDGNPNEYPLKTLVRIFWYIFHTLIEKKSVQIKGIVIIAIFQKAGIYSFNRTRTKTAVQLYKNWLPIKVKCQHGILSSTIMSHFLPIIRFFVGRNLRRRIVIHQGSRQQIINNFEAHGIIRENLPTSIGGGFFDPDWIDRRLEMESRVGSTMFRQEGIVYN